MAFLYLVEGPKNYVGVTKQSLHSRFQGHARSKTYLGHAIRKYGVSRFNIRPLVVGSISYVTSLEERAICVFKTRHPEGYNLQSGGILRETHPTTKQVLRLQKLALEKDPEYRARKSERTKQQWERHRSTMLESLVYTEDRRAKLSESIRLHWQKRRSM